MRTLLVALLSVSIIFAAEKIYEIDSASYELGGYRSFPEFVNNMPGEKDSTLVLSQDPESYDPTSPDYLLSEKRKGKMRPYRDDLWGFSDGKNIFIRTKGKSLFSDNFRKITLGGSFSYYSEWYSVSSLVTAGTMSGEAAQKENVYIIDMKNGKVSALTKPVLRNILRSEDQELYMHFLAEDDNGKKMLEYLNLLNKRLAKK